MECLWPTLLVLGMVYAAAILLAVLDRIFPPVPRPLKGAPLPRFRKRRWLLVWLPLAALGLTIWLIVYGPVILWRRMVGRSAPNPPPAR